MAFTPDPVSPAAASLLLRLERAGGLACAELHLAGAFLLAGAQNGSALIFATSNGAMVQRLAEPAKSASPATCVAWAELESAERVIAGHKSGNVRVWDVERGVVSCTLVAHRGNVTALACMGPLSLLATGSVDTNIKLWALAGGEGAGEDSHGTSSITTSTSSALLQPKLISMAAQSLQGHAAPITRLQFTPDGELLISGDEAGGLRVWHVAGGASGRLLHDLSGNHTAAVTGIACHPEERLFVTCSLDRTVRVWDMDAQPGTCIGLHGPDGQCEVRAVAFAAGGRALLAAYPDGLRTFTLDPLVHHDTADVQWSKVAAIRYTDGKCIGTSLFRGDVRLYCVDLTKLRPFVKGGSTAAMRSGTGSEGASTASQAAGRGGGAPIAKADRSLEEVGAALTHTPALGEKGQGQPAALPHAVSEPVSTIPAAWPRTAGMEQAAPAAAVQQQRQQQQQRQAAVLEPRAVNAGSVEAADAAAATPRPVRRQAQHAAITAATPSRPAQPAAPAAGSALAPTRISSSNSGGIPGSEGKGTRHSHRVSAQENGPRSDLLGGNDAAPKPEPGAAAGLRHCARSAGPSMLAVATHRGFQAAALQRCSEQHSMLLAKRSVWRKVQRPLRRGALREVIQMLEACNDLGVAAKVIESGAIQQQRDRFTLEVCTAAMPLIGALLASGTPLHAQAALQLLDAILARWGGYVRDVLSAPRHGKVDLELEGRQERSGALRSRLQQLVPALERLAAPLGGGRAQQMLDRLRAL